jgi:chaperonin GroES
MAPLKIRRRVLNFASARPGYASVVNKTGKFPITAKERLLMKIRPLSDRILVKRLEEERTLASGIVIPDTAAEKPDQGEVLAVGHGKILEDGKVRPLEIKKGDKVLFGKYAGQAVKIRGEELLVIREDDVMGVLEAA